MLQIQNRSFQVSGGPREHDTLMVLFLSTRMVRICPVSIAPRYFISNLDVVPVFDGREGFDFDNIPDLDETHSEVILGSAILVIFTVHSYTPFKSQMNKFNVYKDDTIICLNIRAIVLLADEDPGFNPAQRPDAWGDGLGVDFPEKKEEDTEDDAPKDSVFSKDSRILTTLVGVCSLARYKLSTYLELF